MMRGTGILFSIILSVVASLTQAQVKETIVNERFYANYLNWPEDAVPDYSSSVNNGTYLLKYNKETGSRSFDISTDLNPGANFFIETSGRATQCGKESGFGIVWGKGRSGFFSFVVSADGSFFVREARADGNNKYLVKRTPSKSIRTGGQENKLRVQFHPEVFEFFVNDVFVARIPFQKFYGDNLGVILYGRQEVAITKFGVFGSRKEVVAQKVVRLTISTYAINDNVDADGTRLGNNNSCINPGENVKMRVSLKNTTNFSSKSLKASVSCDNPNIKLYEQNKKISLPSIASNDVANLMFTFFVAGGYTENSVAFKIDIFDNDNNLTETIPLKVPLNTALPVIDHKDNNMTFTFNIKDRSSDDVNTGFPTTFFHNDNTYAVIIGVENYSYLPQAQFASNDAMVFYNYLVKVLNVPRNHILLVTDYNASKATIANFFKVKGRLANLLTETPETILFYFSGLGSVDPQTGAPFILLSDSRADNAPTSGYPVSEIIQSIHGLRPKSAICFFENSFSGVTRSGEAFDKNGGTFWNLPTLPAISSANSEMALFYASAGEQANPVHEPSQHGLFTYCLLSAIKTSAFSNSTLNMKNLFSIVSRDMMKECTKRGITVVPKLDCINKEVITILK